jgi:hypothetical protein
MILRAVPLLAALLASPALAQGTGDALPSTDGDVPVEASVAEAPSADTVTGPTPLPPLGPDADADAIPAPAALQPAPPSPFSTDQRNGWLAQCRGTFLQAGAALGGGNGLPDACETQLLDFERTYVPTADGRPPTIWVRVPIRRTPAPESPAE